MPFRPPQKNIKEAELHLLLEKKGLSYAQFGKILGYSRGYVSKLIQKQRPITKEFTYRLIQRLLEQKKWEK